LLGFLYNFLEECVDFLIGFVPLIAKILELKIDTAGTRLNLISQGNQLSAQLGELGEDFCI